MSSDLFPKYRELYFDCESARNIGCPVGPRPPRVLFGPGRIQEKIGT
jgi:hypothetical protein